MSGAHCRIEEAEGRSPFGEATLERLALLRIARDRIEAYLDTR